MTKIKSQYHGTCVKCGSHINPGVIIWIDYKTGRARTFCASCYRLMTANRDSYELSAISDYLLQNFEEELLVGTFATVVSLLQKLVEARRQLAESQDTEPKLEPCTCLAWGRCSNPK